MKTDTRVTPCVGFYHCSKSTTEKGVGKTREDSNAYSIHTFFS